jgi:hypothetical protein
MGVVPLGYITAERWFEIFLHYAKSTKNNTCPWNLIADGSRLLRRICACEKVWRRIDLLETVFHSIRSVKP